MSRFAYSIAFSLVTVLIGVGILVSPPGRYIERAFGLNWLFQYRGPVEPPPKVAVIGINSSSGSDMDLSRLPRNWPRSLHAVLTKRVFASGATGLVYDFDFSQPRAAIEDLAFADAIEEAGKVILFERLEGRNERVVSGNSVSRWVWVETAEQPTEVLNDAALSVAPFPLPKIDKSAFQFWAFKPSADDSPTTAAMAVQLAYMPYHQTWREMLDRINVKSTLAPPATELSRPGSLRPYMKAMRKLFLGDARLAGHMREILETATISAEEREAVETLLALYSGPDERYTNYYGPPGTIPTIAYQDMVSVSEIGAAASGLDVEPTDVSRRLDGRMVFAGYSDLYSPDQPDRFHTVFTDERGIDLSGAEIMATAFANLLTDATITRLDAGLSIAIVALFGLVVSQMIFWPSAYIGVPLTLVFGAAYGIAGGEIFSSQALWIPMATPLAVQVLFAIVAGLLGLYLVERRQKNRVSAAMAHYLPEHLTKDLTAGRINEDAFDQVVHGVCFATDMSGFSSISETKSPKELADFMNAYFENIASALKRCEVDVTEFHADTIMCAWVGEPGDVEVRRKAVRAAIEVAHAIETFGADDPDINLRARVGLQDGPFYLGRTGGGGRFTYSILGDPANSAARLESLNKKLGTKLLAAGSVVEGLDGFVLRPLGEFKVVGKENALPVVEIIGLDRGYEAETAELCDEFSVALKEFLAERWGAAAEAFAKLASRFPQDHASRFYREISRKYASDGPPSEHPTRLAMTEK